jgi:hypothetical protein
MAVDADPATNTGAEAEVPTAAAHETSAVSLTYRAPREEPPGASAGDVLQGAVAITLFVLMLAMLAGLMLLALWRREARDDWDPAEWIVFALLVVLTGLGALASFRTLRYYLTGGHRRRRWSPP